MSVHSCPCCSQWEALAREKNWGYVHDEHLDQLVAEVTRWRTIVGTLVSTWNRGWDCSRDPGHVEMSLAIAVAEDALSDSVFGSATKSADGG